MNLRGAGPDEAGCIWTYFSAHSRCRYMPVSGPVVTFDTMSTPICVRLLQARQRRALRQRRERRAVRLTEQQPRWRRLTYCEPGRDEGVGVQRALLNRDHARAIGALASETEGHLLSVRPVRIGEAPVERVDAAGGMPLCSAKGAGWRRRCTAARVCLRRRRVWRWWLRRPRRRCRLRGPRKLWRRRDEPNLRLRVHDRRHAIRWRSMHGGCHGWRKLDAGRVAEEATAGMKRPSRCRVRWCRRNLWRGRREPTLRR